MTTTESAVLIPGLASKVRQFLAAPVQLQTYKNLLYLALAFPLGNLYFVGLTTGGALGLGLLITVVGLPILLATVAGATLAAGLEARLACQLVGVETSLPAFLREFDVQEELALPGNGFLDAIKHLVTAPSTWLSVVLLLTKFVFGLLSFVALVTASAVGMALVSAPFVYDDPATDFTFAGEFSTAQYSIGPWAVETLPEALGVAVGGVVFVFVALNLLNVLAYLQAEYTTILLSVDSDSE